MGSGDNREKSGDRKVNEEQRVEGEAAKVLSKLKPKSGQL